MRPESENNLAAAVLAASISSAVPARAAIAVELNVPAIYAVARNTRPPLDLNATVFRYRVDRSGAIRPVHAALCQRAHHRTRPR